MSNGVDYLGLTHTSQLHYVRKLNPVFQPQLASSSLASSSPLYHVEVWGFIAVQHIIINKAFRGFHKV